MANSPKAEFPPLLPQGFHPYRLDTLRVLCVDQFSGSVSRGPIMDGFDRLVAEINACGLKLDVWVDCSFLTQKLNPEDIDLACCVEEGHWRAATIQQKSAMLWINKTDLKPKYRCDAYSFVDCAPSGPASRGAWQWDRAYWLRQFGFNRKDEPKGVAVLQLPFII
jgi:hypothetical protein